MTLNLVLLLFAHLLVVLGAVTGIFDVDLIQRRIQQYLLPLRGTFSFLSWRRLVLGNCLAGLRILTIVSL